MKMGSWHLGENGVGVIWWVYAPRGTQSGGCASLILSSEGGKGDEILSFRGERRETCPANEKDSVYTFNTARELKNVKICSDVKCDVSYEETAFTNEYRSIVDLYTMLILFNSTLFIR